MTVILDGKKVAKEQRKQNQERVRRLNEKGVTPKLAVLRVGEDPSSISYEKSAASEMKRTGIETMEVTFSAETKEEDIWQALEELNEEKSVHGILIMQPFPKGISSYEASARISPFKDIDGFSLTNMGKLLQPGGFGFIPSTPQAVMDLLEYHEIDVKGKNMTVVGSSPVIGKPLSLLLLNEGATVTNCHIYTENLKHHTQEADILISATGTLGLITREHVKEGAVVIDVGYGYDEEGNVRGDVRYEEVYQKASHITPVPGGVGAITTSILAQHVIKSAERAAEEKFDG